jgi:hypothetical protein
MGLVEKRLAWWRELRPEDVEPVSFWQVRYHGGKAKLTAKLVEDVGVGSRVFVGSFSPRWERLFRDTAPIAVGDPPPMQVEAMGTVVKVTTTTLWVRIGSVHSAEYKHRQVVKLPFVRVGRPVEGSWADVQ